MCKIVAVLAYLGGRVHGQQHFMDRAMPFKSCDTDPDLNSSQAISNAVRAFAELLLEFNPAHVSPPTGVKRRFPSVSTISALPLPTLELSNCPGCRAPASSMADGRSKGDKRGRGQSKKPKEAALDSLGQATTDTANATAPTSKKKRVSKPETLANSSSEDVVSQKKGFAAATSSTKGKEKKTRKKKDVAADEPPRKRKRDVFNKLIGRSPKKDKEEKIEEEPSVVASDDDRGTAVEKKAEEDRDAVLENASEEEQMVAAREKVERAIAIERERVAAEGRAESQAKEWWRAALQAKNERFAKQKEAAITADSELVAAEKTSEQGPLAAEARPQEEQELIASEKQAKEWWQAKSQVREERAAKENEAAVTAERERAAAEKKFEEERREEEKRIAAEKISQKDRLAEEAKAQADRERVAAEEKAEDELLVAAKDEEERIAAEKKTEEEASAQGDLDRIASEKQAKEWWQTASNVRAERSAKQKEAAVTAERERAAAQKKFEEERQEEEERIAVEKKEQDRLAAEARAKAEQDRIDWEKEAQEARWAILQAREKRLDALADARAFAAAEKKTEEERLAAASQEEEERIAAERKAEEDRLAAAQIAAEAERKAEEEQLAAARELREAIAAEAKRVAAEAIAEAKEWRALTEKAAEKVQASSSSNVQDDDANDAAADEKSASGLTALGVAREELLDYLRPLRAGFQATKNELREAKVRLEAFVKEFGSFPEAQAGSLDGYWRLVHTDAPDILGISGAPFAELDFIGQEIDEVQGTCANVIRYRPAAQVQSFLGSFGSLGKDVSEDRLEQRVLLSFKKSSSSSRVEQKLEGIKVTPLKLLGGLITDDWAPPLNANGPLSFPFGSYEILYNDGQLRITRTFNGYLNVNKRVSTLKESWP